MPSRRCSPSDFHQVRSDSVAHSVQTETGPATALPETLAQRVAVANWAILALCLVAFSLLSYWYAPFVPDDSFISYRYAGNLASGQGLTFNPGSPPVEGYSNFLWILLLSGLQSVGLDMTVWAGFVGWLFGALAIVLLWWILRRRGVAGWSLGLTTGLLAISGPITLYAISGLETPLFAMLLLSGVLVMDYLFEQRSVGLAAVLGVVGFLLALCRPEGIVAMPVLALCLFLFSRWPEKNDRPGGLGLPIVVALNLFIALLVVYHVWRMSYFGDFWPTPFLSKGVGGGLPVDTWVATLRNLFIRQTHYYAPFGYYYGALALLALLGAALGWPRRRHLRVEYTALMLAMVYLIVYVNFADWMPGGRYLAPLVGLLLIPLSLLASELQPMTLHSSGREVLPFALIAMMLAAMSMFGVAVLRIEAGQLQNSTAASNVPLGQWLRETMPPQTILGISDVGATPYYSGLETFDMNPASLTDRYLAEHGWSNEYFYEVDPDVVVFTAFSLAKPDFYGVHEVLFAEPRFQDAYTRVGVVRNDWYQDRSYWVFVRRDMALSAADLAAFPPGLTKQ